MTTPNASSSANSTATASFGVVDVLGTLVGLFGLGYGLLLVSQSLLGGLWVAVIGVSLLLAVFFESAWVGERLRLSSATRQTLSLSFGVLAVVLLVAFVVVNDASFSGGSAESAGALVAR